MTAKKTIGITRVVLLKLYAARRFMDGSVREALDLRIPFDVYFQDPLFAKNNPGLPTFDKALVSWEPGLSDGPTSARFAVIDYDNDTKSPEPAAKWSDETKQFSGPTGVPIDEKSFQDNRDTRQAHQVHVWAVLQRALDFFENGFGLGRPISWAFEGSRLRIEPHAGYGRNASYDRQGKSLKFHHFTGPSGEVYTCLSTDIIHHEFAHAVLDGIRPYYLETAGPETAAFHEFVGDLTAILIAFRNNKLRRFVAGTSRGDLKEDTALNRLAEQFGNAVYGRPYLRTARNCETMSKLKDGDGPHSRSLVLTGAMFDIIIALSRHYIDVRKKTNQQAFWHTIQRMNQMAIQPLDLLPPVDVTFRDYALAVLRMEQIANPSDPDNYRGMMMKVFLDREILDDKDVAELKEPQQVFERLVLDVFHDVEQFSGSRAAAYRFLDDNRDRLFIPRNVDVIVSDLYVARKLTREARRLPKQVILQYIWRENVRLEGAQFGKFNGSFTGWLCGGTLAFDQNGNVMAWARKPGTSFSGRGQRKDDDVEDRKRGEKRREAFLKNVADKVKAGRFGNIIDARDRT
jgi:hypothetical protein